MQSKSDNFESSVITLGQK